MKVIDAIQNTDDWYKLRNNYIGASESNIIMGLSKFKTPLQLWEQKVGEAKEEREKQNFIQAKGHRMEEKMRSIMEMLYDTTLEPLVVVSDEYPFLMCSLDGYSNDQGFIWENKYVGEKDFIQVSDGSMLAKYYPQVQHQLLLTGAPFCLFTCVSDSKTFDKPNPNWPYVYCYLEIQPDYKYIQKELLPKLKDFWDCVKNKTPPKFTKDDVKDFSEDEEMCNFLGEYKAKGELIDTLEKELDDLKKLIFNKVGNVNKAHCNGVKITKSKGEDKESFDYKSFIEKNGIPEDFKRIVKGKLIKRITFPR